MSSAPVLPPSDGRELVGQLAAALATLEAMQSALDDDGGRLQRSMKRQLQFLLELAELLERQREGRRSAQAHLRLVPRAREGADR